MVIIQLYGSHITSHTYIEGLRMLLESQRAQ